MWEQDCQEKFQTKKRDVRWKHFYPSEGQLGGKDLKVEADWFLDTGASTHIVADVNNLSENVPYTGTDLFKVGNDAQLVITHIGTSILTTTAMPLTLSNVLCVP